MITKVFRSGNSQAVRLPKALSFPAGISTVEVRRHGRQIILEPLGPQDFPGDFWRAVVGGWPEFKRPSQGRLGERPAVRLDKA